MPRLKTWICIKVYSTGSRSYLVTHSEDEVAKAEEQGFSCRRRRLSEEGHRSV